MKLRTALLHARSNLMLVPAVAAALMGCSRSSQSDSRASPADTSCSATTELFAREVWPKVIASKCINCHAPGGLAAEQHAKLLLYPSAYPGFLQQNLQVLRELAKTEYDGVSVLLRKPLGELQHGGGAQIAEGSDEYTALGSLVQQLQASDPASCAEGAAPAAPAGLRQLDAAATFRKASLLLVGRLPTADELSTLSQAQEAALPDQLGRLLDEPGFLDWVKIAFNDQFLTDRYLNDSNSVLRSEDFPNLTTYFSDATADADKVKYRTAVAREPLELIAYIVKNNLPFTQIVTADHTVLNPYSAAVYNETSISFANPTDETELQPGKIHSVLTGEYPHAGILSSPMFLSRFPTSPTNRNRHRAHTLLKEFLATDILKIGDRPINPSETARFANPTREDPQCSVCHSILDPLAGGFMKFNDYSQAQYQPDNQWHNEMVLPGFGTEQMELSDYPRALQWIGQHIANDPRFPISVTYKAFQALTGQEPLAYPNDGSPGALEAWETQQAALRAAAADFVAAGYNYKALIKELVLSPYFRAENIDSDALAAQTDQVAPYGTGRLSSPESLVRKLRAVVGFDWVRYDKKPQISTTYDILYGGIDSNTVIERLAEPNGVMAAVMSRFSNEISCQATAWDFLQPKASRLLFPYVEPADVPATPEGTAAIQRNIQYLHARILGETLGDSDPELARTYQLFYDTWQEGKAKIESKTLDTHLVWNCRGRWNRLTGDELPEGQRLEDDPSFGIRSWMAVITYLLSDYRFLYE